MISYEKHEAIRQMRVDGFSRRAGTKILGLNRRTVGVYWDIEPGAVPPLTRTRAEWFEGHEDLIRALFMRHKNCDVVRRELLEQGLKVPSIRSVKLAVEPYRAELKAEKAKKARQRVESFPGDIMEIGYGVSTLKIAGIPTQVHFFVAVLAYSRRRYVLITDNEDCVFWQAGIEGAFKRFGGIPRMILCDNAKALVSKAAHVGGERQLHPNHQFAEFCRYWDVVPIIGSTP